MTRPRVRFLVLIVASLFAWGDKSLLAAGLTADASRANICAVVDQAAAANRLPADFLTRVLWQESRFRSEATSPAGAEGIAQFMPPTAAARGLSDPRDPGPAIAAAARMLADLRAGLGNIGLAAAAYNAGTGRITKWLRAEADLPLETRIYVRAVTGRQVEDWVRGAPGMSGLSNGRRDVCRQTMAQISRTGPTPAAGPVWQARLDDGLARFFGLAAGRARRQIDRDQQRSRGPRALCDRLRALGAVCAVYSP